MAMANRRLMATHNNSARLTEHGAEPHRRAALAVRLIADSFEYQGVCIAATGAANEDDTKHVPAGCQPYEPRLNWGMDNFEAIIDHLQGTGTATAWTEGDQGARWLLHDLHVC
jgi:hypothetical protein